MAKGRAVLDGSVGGSARPIDSGKLETRTLFEISSNPPS